MFFSIFGLALAYDSFNPGKEWRDTAGNLIEAHGGHVSWVEYDCFNNHSKGCWIWYGEDHDTNLGFSCYISSDLYNWENKGLAFHFHDIAPVKLPKKGSGVDEDENNKNELKRRANLDKPDENATLRDIKVAHDFLQSYVTKIDEKGKFLEYNEIMLRIGFKYMYNFYCVNERPRMLYNAASQKYVLIFHNDGPTNGPIIRWLESNKTVWNGTLYSRANLAFATSDSPFGPFKLVNVHRMHWVKDFGRNRGMSLDETAFLDDDGIPYVIYASEENQYLYVSKLSSDYQNWEKPPGMAINGVDFKARMLNVTSRVAPIIFKYQNVYYLMTSDNTKFAASEAKWHRAFSMFGPYEEMGNPCQDSETCFNSQPTHFINYNKAMGQFIYFGDRWNNESLKDSRYVWLPVVVDRIKQTIKINNRDSWKIEDLKYGMIEKSNIVKTNIELVVGIVASSCMIVIVIIVIVLISQRSKNNNNKYEEI